MTLLIPTHNRHSYLDRILEYYRDGSIGVVVADSSKQPYQAASAGNLFYRYLHFPGLGMPEKLDLALQQVGTPYVVMCADDDFLIPEGVLACVEFLEENKEFTAAQGNSINYRIDAEDKTRLDFRIMYKDPLSFQIGMDDPFERLERLFNPYKSFFYAVHRTGNLKNTFHHAGRAIRNLYLNEYLTAVIPIMLGKYAELPVFYQVREYSEYSDDKVTDNLDKLFFYQQYRDDRDAYLDFLTDKVFSVTGRDKKYIREKLEEVLLRFAETIRSTTPAASPLKKSLGRMIARIPFIGNRIIAKNRKREIDKHLRKIIRTQEDNRNLAIVGSAIKKYQHAIQ